MAADGWPSDGQRGRGEDIGSGAVVLEVRFTMLIAHSDKEGGRAHLKRTFGFRPILVTRDNAGELLAPMTILRRGTGHATP